MRMLSKAVSFLVLSLFLIGNVVIFLGDNYIPFANAQVVLPSGQIVTPGNNLISGSNIFGNNQAFPQAATLNTAGSTCDTTQNGIVTVTKAISDPNNIASGTANTLSFTLVLTNNGFPNTFTLTGTSTQAFCIGNGHTISVTETVFPTQFTFSSPTFSSGCSSTVQAGASVNCLVTNTITGTGTGSSTSAAPQSTTISGTPSASASPNSASPQSAVIPEVAAKANPPFQTCTANLGQPRTIGGANAVPNGIKTDLPGTASATNPVVRQPSENTITVEGIVPLDRVRSALSSLDTNTFTIQFIQELNPTDGIKTGLANPFLSGRVIVTSDDGVKQKIINFNVQNARTECKFITLAKAIGQPNNNNIVALGQLQIPGTVRLADTNKVLAGIGSFVQPIVPNTANAFPQAINPPFATCVAPSITVTNGVPSVSPDNLAGTDNLALYNIRGDIKSLNQVSGNSLVVVINSDIVFADTDHAIITNNNNPLVKVNLISNPNKSNAHQINFAMNDLWTDCKSVASNTQEIFNVFPGENAP